jgi:hypothetical protein
MCGLATPALLLKFLLYPQIKFNKITVYKPVKATVTPGVTKVENNTPLQKKSDKCFRCNEKWFPGHKMQCKMNKQIRAMITLDDDKSENHTEEDNAESETKPDETETQASLQSQLSMYAVQATSSAVSTVVLTG